MFQLKLWIFPEGTRSSGDEMLPFKKGAFHLAITSQLPVSPVVFSRYLHVDHKQQRFETGEVIITVLPPISTEGMTLQQLPELMEQVQYPSSRSEHVFRSRVLRFVPA